MWHVPAARRFLVTRGILAIVAVTLTSGAAAYADAVDFYRPGLDHLGYFPEESVSPTPRVIQKYGLINVGIHSASKSSPIVDAGQVFVGADSGFLYALNAEDLSLKWRFRIRPQAKNGIHGTPAVDRDCVYIGGYDGWLYALDRADGRLKWQSKLGGSIGSSPVIWGEKIYVGVETRRPDGYLTCVWKKDGKECFRSETFGDHTHATPTLNTKTRVAFIGANSHRFYAINADSGKTLWRYETKGDIKSTAALFEDKVLITSWDGHLYNFEQDSGDLVWKFKTGGKSMSSPSIDTHKRRVFFGSHDFKMYAVDFDSGEEIWSYKTGKRIISSPTVVRNRAGNDNVVIFGSADGTLYGLSDESGAELFKFETQGKLSSVVTVKDGRFYLSGDDGWLYVFQ